MIELRDTGCVLLRFVYPNGQQFHLALHELGNPYYVQFMKSCQRWWGVPTLMEPNLMLPRPARAMRPDMAA
jgi:hypothetical protein